MATSNQSQPKLKTKLKCPFCFEIFGDGPALIKHLACHNLVERKGNENKNISSQSSLQKCYVKLTRCDNLVQSSEISVKPGTSGDIKFGLKKPLIRRYAKIRKGDKLFRCTKCPKTYYSKWSLKTHFRNHTGQKPYRCTYCDRAFIRPEVLKVHIRSHTGEKPYSCQYCGRSFAYSCNFKSHVRYHTGEKPYHCTFCDQSFTHLSNLNTHVRIHTGEKPFDCPYCNYKCAQKQNLKRHYMGFHKLTNLEVINS